MELEVSYHETYYVEGQAERRRGAPESVDGGGEVVDMDCVDRHTFFITPLMLLSREADRSRAHHEPSASPSHDNQDSYGGVAGQNLVLCKHLQQPLALVERLRCPERLWERCSARQM